MIEKVRDWLPIETLATPAVRSEFETVIGSWSARWFGERHVKIVDMRTRDSRASLVRAKANWYCFAPGVFLDWGEQAQLSLACHGLHAIPSNAVPSNADSKLLTAFAEKIVEDLAEALAKALGTNRNDAAVPGEPYQRDGGIELRVAAAEGPCSITIGISAHALVALRRRLCPVFTKVPVEPFELMEALADVPVPFKAALGKGRMTARELTYLAQGDIVILDAACDAPIILAAEGSNRALCATELGRDGQELVLRTIEFEGVTA